MSQTITPISLLLPFGMGTVNCYLLPTGDGFALIDTGAPNSRTSLDKELERHGCHPGLLKLILITHGDFDHIGNAAYLRKTFSTKIAMQAEEARMAETGDMFANRQGSNALVRILSPRLIGFGKADRFTPDILIHDETSLAEYGVPVRAIPIPGHSNGSIGFLTDEGDFFSGDLLDNTKQPAPGSLVDDRQAMQHSLASLNSLGIQRIYPGHGRPFAMSQLAEYTI
jgi:hydroxyacylglutathione hydrolase